MYVLYVMRIGNLKIYVQILLCSCLSFLINEELCNVEIMSYVFDLVFVDRSIVLILLKDM